MSINDENERPWPETLGPGEFIVEAVNRRLSNMVDLTLYPWTHAQQTALHIIYNRRWEKPLTFERFASTAEYFRDYIGIKWCGMMVGIEPDGYTHT